LEARSGNFLKNNFRSTQPPVLKNGSGANPLRLRRTAVSGIFKVCAATADNVTVERIFAVAKPEVIVVADFCLPS
jgi:hypothetical protein